MTPIDGAVGKTVDLDRLIHERLRLGIISALAVNESLGFTELRDLLKRTKEEIAEHWAGERSEAAPGSIEVYIHRLRRKIEGSGLAIRTVRGLGYLLEDEAR